MALFDKKKRIESHEGRKDISSLSGISVVTPRSWFFLITAGIICFLIGLWLFLGYIPVTIQGKGIIVSKSGLAGIQAKIAGSVMNLSVHAGDDVNKGQLLLEIYDPQLELKLKSSETRVKNVESELSQLKKEIEEERKAHEIALQAKLGATQFNVSQLEDEIDFLTKKLQNHKTLLDKGLISGAVYHSEEQALTQKKIDLEEKKSALNEIISEMKKEFRPEELRNKEQQLLTEVEQRDVLLAQLSLSKVVSPDDGRILEIMVNTGDQVQPGKQLIWLERKSPEQNRKDVTIYAYFPVELGKRIHLGTQVEMTVPEVNHNEYGAILGKVKSISPYAVSEENIYEVIQNKSLVDDLMGSNKAVVEAIIDPERDSQHPDLFKWTSGKQPPNLVSTGTVGMVEATVEKVRPIYYLLPLPAFKQQESNKK